MNQVQSPETDEFELSLTRRNPTLAIGANLLLAPLGHVYAGQAGRGFAIWGATLTLAVIGSWFVVRHPGTPAVAFLGGTLGIGLGLLLVDVVVLTRKSGERFEPRPYNRPWAYAGLALLVCLVDATVQVEVRDQILQAYRMPSEGMGPTLLVGDYLLVDKTAQGKRGCHRGDIVVIPYPSDATKEFMKRVVGLPNETIEIREKKVYIDGRPLDEPYAVHLDDMMLNPKFSPRDVMEPVKLGPHALFLLGDNRDNSNDSRFWGPMPEYLVRGRTIMIYWSWDRQKFAPRWDRVGAVVTPKPAG